MSRQREWQVLNVKAGFCSICGRGVICKCERCFECYKRFLLQNREHMRKVKGCNEWKEGGVGRPQINFG